MAPKRERTKPTETEHAPKRVTRSSTRLNGTQSELAVTQTSPIKKKTPKKKVPVKVKKTPVKEVPVSAASKVPDVLKSKTIVIEHCKQCNAFKTRAFQVKDGLEKGVSGVTVIVNPEKPRRGCFEIRDDEGKKFISLLEMKRPFSAMKELDMDNVIADIVEDIK
ncbi:uncharacterized protein LOC124942769 [Impatiens glandulifera]|uniref:uncharacterized protein LOC124942769 n=1 Tax=Impatiens glandulifera TaxID=253017 RepID=UPI001FB0B6CB|nr:uncharacterized protein LOC124942769 [Impatiens glandulifera]